MLVYFYFRWHKIIKHICFSLISFFRKITFNMLMNDSKEGIKFKRLNNLKKVPDSPCWSRFHLTFSLLFAIWVSLFVFCHYFIPWMNKKLRATSPLLIVIAGWEGSHWVLTTLPFIRKLWSHSIQWEWGNVGVIYELLGVWIFPFIPPPLSPSLSLTHLLFREIYLTFVSARLGVVLNPIWGCLSSPGVMTWTIRLQGLETSVLQDLMKSILSPSHLQKLSRRKDSKWVHKPTCYVESLECSGSPMRVRMCYLYFCSKLTSILSN